MFDTIESVTKSFTTAVTKLDALAVRHQQAADNAQQVSAAALTLANIETAKAAKAAVMAIKINNLLN